MIDRSARNQAVAAIEAYLDDKITAFEFDERLGIDTQDVLVNEITALAWFHYDDCKDHQVVMTLEQWNLFQRLLLLLRSDAEASASPKPPGRWRWDNALALTASALYCALAMLVGWNGWLLLLALPFAPLSKFIHQHRVRTAPVMSLRELACFPFASFAELRQVRRGTPDFSKRRYRTEIRGRAIRNEVEQDLSRAKLHLGWVLFSPLVLFSQSFPCSDHQGDAWVLKLP